MVNMWKYISRNVRETFERRICSSLTDSSGQDNSTCKFKEKFLPTIHSFCYKQSASGEKYKWASRDEKREEKNNEHPWNDANIRHSWFGALGWSTALVLSWNLLQPLGRLQYAQENTERHKQWSTRGPKGCHWKRDFGSHHKPSHWQFACPLSRRSLKPADGTWDSGHHSHEKNEHRTVKPPDDHRASRWNFVCPLSRRFHGHGHGQAGDAWDSDHHRHEKGARKAVRAPDDEWDSGNHSLGHTERPGILDANSVPLQPPTDSSYTKFWKFLTQTVWAQPTRIVAKPAKLGIDYISAQEDAVKYGPPTADQALDDATEKLIEAQNSVMGDIDNRLGVQLMEQGKHHEAVSRFSRAIGFKNASAAYNLGVCYEMGLGTNQDFKEAAKYYQLASEKDHPTAMYNLGVFYVHGWGGLSSDCDEAQKLFERASALGQNDAKKALGMVKIKEVPQPSPQEKADNSLDLIQRALGLVQELGIGFQQDSKQSEHIVNSVDHKDISDMVHDSILKYTSMLQK